MFIELKNKIKERFDEMCNGGNLFVVDSDPHEIWDIYLNAFEDEYKQSNNCNCCKGFIRRVGNVVSIKDGEIQTLWGDIDDVPKEYQKSVKALDEYIKSKEIRDVFYQSFKTVGADSTLDAKRSVYWNHFCVNVPYRFVKNKDLIPKLLSDIRDSKNVLERGLTEISEDAVDTVLDLINQNSLYRGLDYEFALTKFKKLKNGAKNATNLSNYVWSKIHKLPTAVSRIKNSSIGNLLLDISNGVDLDRAVASFESMVAPTNYKRPTALITSKQINETKKYLESAGLIKALERSQMSRNDLNVNNSLWVFRKQYKNEDAFDVLEKNVVANPKSFNKIEEVTIQDFIEKVLPSAKKISVLLENKHFNNFVTLVKPEEGNILKWSNGVSWSYTGQLADSIKERVKLAGGDTDAFARVSLSWYNSDDLDLHVIEPSGERIYFSHKRSDVTDGYLDVDMNAYSIKNNPVENIRWKDGGLMAEGTYKIYVDKFRERSKNNLGCEIELELGGDVYNIEMSDSDIRVRKQITFNFSTKNGFKVNLPKGKESTYNSKEKWGVKSGTWVPLKALALSPNYWEGNGTGNKHFFFFLEGIKCDEKIRAFYNEMLSPDLDSHRKVMEHLGSVIEVKESEDELSGIGFSETLRNDLIVEVEGTFKRKLKIKF